MCCLCDSQDTENAKETIKSIKKLLGMEDVVHPVDGAWLTMYATEHKSGQMKRKKMGRVLVRVLMMMWCVCVLLIDACTCADFRRGDAQGCR